MKTKRMEKRNQGYMDSKELGESKTLMEHLLDFRKVLIFSTAVIVLFFLVIWLCCSEWLLNIVAKPLIDRNITIVYTAIAESFSAQMKVSFLFAVILAFPFVLGKLWRFVAPSLYRREKFVYGGVFFIVLLLFVLGILFAYLIVFHMAINFFVFSSGALAKPMISIESYVGFMIRFMIPFGITFELPLVILILTKLQIVKLSQLMKSQKYVILLLFVLAAILTPPDVISQIMLGLPLTLLYEIGVLGAAIVTARRKRRESYEAESCSQA
ncbi:twin-arginine translocase subunit TatC [Lachnoclostridium phytofermentans]|uniref:Sec-independent protein translocase protein TatC n=1 Tax=Lachnoclostridium phytofermentans (strain ATCC 700394 / DSM 18823 / ISDg) TaxID=357809 RepID=A9KHC2_LACP7|nr:twin-arginine translocase subunit TatC [Lachnoclostridium phytofermentans]ABX40789.1 Sec-independent protein translocase, TatC subunit [Lachnoclostridium phytofermentans ISDg]